MNLDASPSGFLAAAPTRDTGVDAPVLKGIHLDAVADASLIPLALSGDRDAWNVLIKRHERRVLLMLLARGVRVDRAKDIVQDTWARLIAQQREGRFEWLDLPGLAVRQAMYL